MCLIYYFYAHITFMHMCVNESLMLVKTQRVFRYLKQGITVVYPSINAEKVTAFAVKGLVVSSNLKISISAPELFLYQLSADSSFFFFFFFMKHFELLLL